MLHAFSRFELLVGEEAIEKLAKARVAVFGVGGVGSFVVEGLARSGVGRFILIDDDLVCLTNLNRQILATRKTIGKPKVEAMKERILDINPKAEVETHKLFYLPETAGELLDREIDYIVDAIDTVTAKIDLVMKAKEKGIPIISSMGTGNKFDPTKLEITDISKTSVDPLARVMRKELRDRGITSLKVLFSREEPSKTFETEQNSCRECCVCPKGTERKCTDRRSIPGSTAFVPPAGGLIIAGEVVKDLLGRGTPAK
jgi:tRNA A37 threonylcarbamoyladenosine dehydratase